MRKNSPTLPQNRLHFFTKTGKNQIKPTTFDDSDCYSSDYSSSIYYSDSIFEIPVINSSQKKKIYSNKNHSKAILISDDDSDEYSDENHSIQINKNDQDNEDRDESNDLIEIKEPNIHNDNENESIENSESNIENNANESENLNTEQIEQFDANQVNQQTTNIELHTQENECQNSILTSYEINWTKSRMSKNNFQFISSDDKILFQSKKFKTKLGKCYIICKNNSKVDPESDSYIGSLKISENQNRYTLFTQNNNCEVMGLSFIKISDSDLKFFRYRAFRVVFPKEQPYFPSTKKMKLSQIAKKNVQLDDFTIYSSKFPEIKNNHARLDFKCHGVLISTKNFIVEDENENIVFMIYKSSDEVCTVKISQAIDPLFAFCISIAVITSKN